MVAILGRYAEAPSASFCKRKPWLILFHKYLNRGSVRGALSCTQLWQVYCQKLNKGLTVVGCTCVRSDIAPPIRPVSVRS